MFDDDVAMSVMYGKTFNKRSTTQDVGAIPNVYQIRDANGFKNEFMNSTLCQKETNVDYSAAFKSQGEIVKSFSKILNPRDTLDFRLTNHLGPDIKFDITQNYLRQGAMGNQHSAYSIIVEFIGPPCEAVRFENNAIFQGTCPGWYNYEYQKSIKLVKNTRIVSNFSDLTANFDSNFAVKIHERKFLSTPPLSVPVDQIGKPGEEGKTFMVVSTSSEEPGYLANIANQPKSKEVLIQKSEWIKREKFLELGEDFDQISDEALEEFDENDEGGNF